MNETKHSFVLASSSPRRIELLNSIKIFPKIIYSSDINEDINSKESPKKYCIRVAKNKALKALEKYPEEFVLSADTIVFCSNKIFLKPKEQTDFAMVLWLSDQMIKNQNINSLKIKSMANKQLNHDYLPHTLLNLFKVQSSVYKKDFSLIN